jgi:iron-sulfur cluster assembly protein
VDGFAEWQALDRCLKQGRSLRPRNPKGRVADERLREQETMAITLTDKAAQHVQKYLARRGKGVGLRLGVRTTGCSGLAYKLEYVDELAPEDQVFESAGVKIIIDPKSLAYLDGTELDFAREGLNEGFRFNNPNAKDECGCGESFRV